MSRKAMLGHKVRRLRRESGISQTQLAEQLEISPSYLNLIEHNQRPVSADLLIRIARVFDVDLQTFAEDVEGRLAADLREVFADPLFEGGGPAPAQEIRDLAANAPTVAQAVIDLYRAFREARDDLRTLAERIAADRGGDLASVRGAATDAFPIDRVHDFFQAHANHFPAIEEAAEALWREAELEQGDLYRGLASFLQRMHGVRARVMPHDVMQGALRRYDPHGRRLLLNEMLPGPSRTFHLAHQVALLYASGLLDRVAAEDGKLQTDAARRLCRIGLANYLAGAVMMPYEAFIRAAQSVRYDIAVLQRRFDASFEQVCHRLTSLQRPGLRGVPFSFLRVDKAGNISKRHSGGSLHFARFDSACPRLNIYDAFRFPGVVRTQVAILPDGATYLCIARDVVRAASGHRDPPQHLAIGLACDIAHAPQLVYADGIDLGHGAATPVGPTCRVCERLDCAQRAFPPIGQRLVPNEHVRGQSSYVRSGNGG
ncbi:MAG TPA: short-chain fatty acyl-CoA regulator family protein [Stellaceae bacterium]